jgi:cell surface protein SprA
MVLTCLQNEQAMSFKIRNLAANDIRGAFKTMNLDMRQYGSLHMFLHAESIVGSQQVNNNQLNAVIRIGSDFLNNYYEIKIPLRVTPPGNYPNTEAGQKRVWPDSNNLDFDIQDLVQLKIRRNNQTFEILPVTTRRGLEIKALL